MKLEKIEEQVFFSTVRISTSKENVEGASIGTGFLISIPVNDATAKKAAILLISNKHVFKDPKHKIELNFTKKQKNENKPDLGKIHKFLGEDYDDLYTEHPNPNVDLACLNISQIGNHNLYFRVIQEDLISNFEEEELLPGLSVWFVGYPENRYDVSNNLPLLRKGYIASIPKVDYNLAEQFVIDAQVFQGSSGSPVFVSLNDKYKLIGIISQTMIKQGKLKAVPTVQTQIGVDQILGLGIVIKSTLLKELINKALSKV